MKRPSFLVLFGYIIGILLAYFFKIDIFLFFIFITCFIVILLVLDNRGKKLISLFFLPLILAIIISNLQLSSDLDKYSGRDSNYLGIIDKIKIDDKKTKLEVILISVDDSYINERIMLTTDNDNDFLLGQTLSFNGTIKKAKTNTNPNLFNYKQYLLTKKIHYTIYLESESINIINQSIPFKYVAQTKFQNLIKNNFSSLPKDSRDLMVSTILGDSSYLDDYQYDIYKDIGLIHLLAVSGLHINLISSFIIFILANLGLNRKLNLIITIIVITVYGYLIGYPPSSVRAILMISLSLYSSLVYKPYDSLNSLYIAAIISLFINPFWIFRVGFLLSYIASFSILVFSKKMNQFFYPYKGRLINSLSTILSVNICLIPVQIYFFNSFNFLSILANLIIIPLASINLIIGFSSILFNKLIDILYYTIYIQNSIIYRLSLYQNLNFTLKSPSIEEFVIYIFLIILIFNPEFFLNLKNEIKRVIIYFTILFILVMNFNYFETKNDIIIDFIDVGQGDSSLLRYKDKNILIDTGGSVFSEFDVGKNITLPFLLKSGVNKLDLMIISHFDADHYKGSKAIIENIDVKNIVSSDTPDDSEFLMDIQKSKIPFHVLSNGSKIMIDDNFEIEILWPGKNTALKDSGNNNSLVCLVKANGHKLLFTGDIEKKVEKELIKTLDLDVDILKVAHHGSKTSTDSVFIEKTSPIISIISVGEGNNFGHPADETIETLEKANSKIYRTDKSGLIRVIIKEDKLVLSTYSKPFYQEDLYSYLIDKMFDIFIFILYLYLSFKLICIYRNLEERLNGF